MQSKKGTAVFAPDFDDADVDDVLTLEWAADVLVVAVAKPIFVAIAWQSVAGACR